LAWGGRLPAGRRGPVQWGVSASGPPATSWRQVTRDHADKPSAWSSAVAGAAVALEGGAASELVGMALRIPTTGGAPRAPEEVDLVGRPIRALKRSRGFPGRVASAQEDRPSASERGEGRVSSRATCAGAPGPPRRPGERSRNLEELLGPDEGGRNAGLVRARSSWAPGEGPSGEVKKKK